MVVGSRQLEVARLGVGSQGVSAYRFCRTDDVDLLVDALNRCWSPYFPSDPPDDARGVQAVDPRPSGLVQQLHGRLLELRSDGVLIGAKRPSGTLVHRIAVHPDHRRRGHGRHMLTSLGQKLAILGPPRLVAEVPETLVPARELFRAAGYVEEAQLTDYILSPEHEDRSRPDDGVGFVIPVTVDDLAANGLLEPGPLVCWSRAVDTITARKHDIAGLAVAQRRADRGLRALRGRFPDGGDPVCRAPSSKTAEFASRSCSRDWVHGARSRTGCRRFTRRSSRGHCWRRLVSAPTGRTESTQRWRGRPSLTRTPACQQRQRAGPVRAGRLLIRLAPWDPISL